MIALDQTTKCFGSTTAVSDLSLTLRSGETTVLIGSSGSGKSTLLRLMLGLTLPDSGTVLFDGCPLVAEALTAARHRIGYVVQDGGLFPHLSAGENAALMTRHLGWAQDRVTARLAELRELVQLPSDALERYPAQLSGGQRQRVGLMRALMLDPEVLLLDEPLGALDPIVRAELRVELREIFRALHKTVVLVTHDVVEAAWFGDRVVLMRAGRIVQEGPLRELIEHPSDPFVTRFIDAQRSGFEALGGASA